MIINKKKWNEFVERNQKFSYGKMLVDYTRAVIKMLDDDDLCDFDIEKIFDDAKEECSKWEIDISDLGLFFLSRVAFVIWQCHDKGDFFAKQWNKWFMTKEVPDQHIILIQPREIEV